MYYNALRPRPKLHNTAYSYRLCELSVYQPEAKRQNITVKWNLDDKLNVSNVNRLTGSVHPRMREFSYAH